MGRERKVNWVLDRDRLMQKIIDCYSVRLYERQMKEEINESTADKIMYAYEKRLRDMEDAELLNEADLFMDSCLDYFYVYDGDSCEPYEDD